MKLLGFHVFLIFLPLVDSELMFPANAKMGRSKKKGEGDAPNAFAIQYKSGTLPQRMIKDLSEMMKNEQTPQEKRIAPNVGTNLSNVSASRLWLK